MWDSLLADGRRWSITASSDSHAVATGASSTRDGHDFWPGEYSRTVVGATAPTYEAIMDGIRNGRAWVGHGDLISSLDTLVGPPGFADYEGVPLGGQVTVPPGGDIEVRVGIGLPKTPNGAGRSPRLARVDLITGRVHRRAQPDPPGSPGAFVAASFDIGRQDGEITLRHTFRSVREAFYIRVRGTDGNRSAPGSIEPAADLPGADPWSDLWFYANPIAVDIRA